MFNSPAVQIMSLFGVIIASGLLLALVNDLISSVVSKRHVVVNKPTVLQPRISPIEIMPTRVSYATTRPVKGAVAANRYVRAKAETPDLKVVTVRMRRATHQVNLPKAA